MSIADLVFDDSADCISRTKQSFAEECDINRIVARYASSGDVSGLAIRSGRFINASLTQDFKASQDAIADLRSIYEARPDLHADFPTIGHFMTAFEDPDRFDGLVKHGVLGPKALASRTAAIEAARAKAKADSIAATAPEHKGSDKVLPKPGDVMKGGE